MVDVNYFSDKLLSDARNFSIINVEPVGLTLFYFGRTLLRITANATIQ